MARKRTKLLAALRKKVKTFIKEFGEQKVRRMAIISVVLILVGAIGLRYKYFIVPAAVNGQPIFFWEYFSKLHQIAGTQVLDQIVSERVISQEALRLGVVVTQAQINEEEQKIEEQFAQSGGLEAILASQGITKNEFERQLRLSLFVRSILTDEVTVDEDEVNLEYEETKDQYTDLEESEAKNQIREALQYQRIQSQITPWLENLKASAQVEIYLP